MCSARSSPVQEAAGVLAGVSTPDLECSGPPITVSSEIEPVSITSFTCPAKVSPDATRSRAAGLSRKTRSTSETTGESPYLRRSTSVKNSSDRTRLMERTVAASDLQSSLQQVNVVGLCHRALTVEKGTRARGAHVDACHSATQPKGMSVALLPSGLANLLPVSMPQGGSE